MSCCQRCGLLLTHCFRNCIQWSLPPNPDSSRYPVASASHMHIFPYSWPPQVLCHSVSLREEECMFAWLGMRYMPGYNHRVRFGLELANWLSAWMESRSSAAHLLASAVLQWAKEAPISHVGPLGWDPHTQIGCPPLLSPFSSESFPGAQSDLIIFLPLPPDYVCIFLTALVEQDSFCQFLVNFQWGLFFIYICFVCVSFFFNWRIIAL